MNADHCRHDFRVSMAISGSKEKSAIRYCKLCGKSWQLVTSPYSTDTNSWREIKEPTQKEKEA